MKSKSKILIIAGSDSSGGAGIQADIKTITAFKCYALSVVTALVAQNTTGVKSILDIPLDFIAAQIDCVLEDINIDSLKIGMLHRTDIVNLISEKIVNSSLVCPLVIDPVMVAKSGDSLLTEDARKALIRNLIPHATLITPNIPEAEVLTKKKIKSLEDMIFAANILLKFGVKNILIKGGHRNTKIMQDVFLNKKELLIFKNKKIKTKIPTVLAVHYQLQLQLFLHVEKA